MGGITRLAQELTLRAEVFRDWWHNASLQEEILVDRPIMRGGVLIPGFDKEKIKRAVCLSRGEVGLFAEREEIHGGRGRCCRGGGAAKDDEWRSYLPPFIPGVDAAIVRESSVLYLCPLAG